VSRISFDAESSSRSAWNARAAVVRCSGARVFLTPSHVKARRTAAIVVRSLWAALGEVWVVGLVVGWLVDRLVVCGLVRGSVVVAVDIWVREISLKMGGWKARPQRHEAARAWKSHWLAPVLKAYDGRSAIEATGEPSGRDRRNQRAKIPDERRRTGRRASIEIAYGAARGTPYRDRREKRKKEERDRFSTGADVGRHEC